ncbi:MAG: c-type cytochrome [Myxococcales bacterium]|nr:c-type cytochrome [Myxococcales bacterium]
MPRRSSLGASIVASLALAALALLTSDCAQEAPTAEKGNEHYTKYCALCHGAVGEGYRADDAPALRNTTFLTLSTDAFLEHAVLRGRPGTTMSPWAKDRGGPLDETAARSIVLYLRGLAPHAPVDTSGLVVRGDPAAGAPIYAARCADCHGARGELGRYVNLANPELLASASDGFLLRSIEEGRPGTPMPAFAGTLSPKEIADVVALVRSWQRPPDGPLPSPPRPGQLADVVLNATGENASFPGVARFVPADTVKAALDQRRRLVLLDARPPYDYARAHVSGAVSTPFYEAADYASQLPRNAPIVAYCGCPHAESGQAVDTLKGLGYSTVYVLDEGFTVWRERGYPVRGGAKP